MKSIDIFWKGVFIRMCSHWWECSYGILLRYTERRNSSPSAGRMLCKVWKLSSITKDKNAFRVSAQEKIWKILADSLVYSMLYCDMPTIYISVENYKYSLSLFVINIRVHHGGNIIGLKKGVGAQAIARLFLRKISVELWIMSYKIVSLRVTLKINFP